MCVRTCVWIYINWLELDLVWHYLKNPRYHYWYHRELGEKVEYHWSESRAQKEVALGLGSVNPHVFVTNLARLGNAARHSRKESGSLAHISACVLISYYADIFHSNALYCFPRKFYSLGLKTRSIYWCSGDFHRSCFRGLHHLCEDANIYV